MVICCICLQHTFCTSTISFRALNRSSMFHNSCACGNDYVKFISTTQWETGFPFVIPPCVNLSDATQQNWMVRTWFIMVGRWSRITTKYKICVCFRCRTILTIFNAIKHLYTQYPLQPRPPSHKQHFSQYFNCANEHLSQRKHLNYGMMWYLTSGLHNGYAQLRDMRWSTL